MQRIAKFGGPEAYNHYAVGWAHALDTPYQWTKQVASHWEERKRHHRPLAQGDQGQGEIRSQFFHVIDVARPSRSDRHPGADGRQQCPAEPIEGTSMLYSFDDARRWSDTRRSTSRCSATAGSTTRAGAL